MLVATEVFIRWEQSASPALMRRRKDEFVLPKSIDGDKSEAVRRHQHQQPRHLAPWPLDQTVYADEDEDATQPPRVFYFDRSMEQTNMPPLAAEPATRGVSTGPYEVDFSGDGQRPIEETSGECVPMKEWQTAFFPTCNNLHELDFMQQSQRHIGGSMNLFLTNGYWRNAWRVDYGCIKRNDTHIEECNEMVVLKTLKLEHDFDITQYERNRVDSMAMERLTSSEHVIDVFGACSHSVVTEFADGERVGTLADAKKRIPLERLKIARDIAAGLADVHSIDGEDEATLAHFDVNLANVVSVGGRLKLNDFNIGVLLQRNATDEKACGFPAMYPNPQWRSPEEANGSLRLNEKVDVFSLGHIFFRLICLNEPWHKLEEGYSKGDAIRKGFVNEQVKKGVLPTIPTEVLKTKDAEVKVIREAMLACYTYDPEMRPSARTIANFLDRGIAELEKHSFLRKPSKDHWGSFQLVKK
ncbi:hypothetical protein ACHAXT_004023 [Thalassiosira profunda]